ncbi:uncharacterized protein PRCAT00006020001 [Priceomyces carsonii]|uniref:uncharacterized protein n=1 Tax=Priceomyces carsonii TaxID=28549 RepID=UPI002ED9DC23|nr:unnamed protein product [Priceomyces carsonii]
MEESSKGSPESVNSQPQTSSNQIDLDRLAPATHGRSDSTYSRNYSLLRIYENDCTSDNGELEGTTEEQPLSNDLNNTIESSQSYIEPICSGSINSLLSSDFDRYGFKKASTYHKTTVDQYNNWFGEYSQYCLRRKRKWNLLMKNNGLQLSSEADIPTRFPPRSDKVKKMIRRGIPAEWRGNAWFFYAGGYEKLSKNTGVYAQVVHNTQGIKNKDTEVIERDLKRTFPDNIYFNDTLKFEVVNDKGDDPNLETPPSTESKMIQSLRRVLVAFAHHQPQIGYCQSLNFLAGLLLLFMNEERAFWLLVIMTERIIPKVHSADLEGVHTDQGVLMLCVKEYIPQLWAILGKNFDGEVLTEDRILTRLPPVTLVTSSWFMSVFVGVLPVESTLRIWDILWYEGSKTIFRVSLTICRMCFDSPEFQKARTTCGGTEMEQIELFQLMQNFPKSILDPNILVDNCFKKIGGYGYGSLSQEEINKCRIFVSKQRAKLKSKKNSGIAAEMTDEERKALMSGSLGPDSFDDVHDIYGFHRSIMSGITWNKHISNRMKKRFSRKK